ncbi:MAG: hypothetical protein WB341_03345 [Terracidiphilus sp.]
MVRFNTTFKGELTDSNSIAALSAAAAACFSLVALILTYFQLKQFRFAHGVDLISGLEDRFETPEMMDVRKSAAKALRSGTCNQGIEPVVDLVA